MIFNLDFIDLNVKQFLKRSIPSLQIFFLKKYIFKITIKLHYGLDQAHQTKT